MSILEQPVVDYLDFHVWDSATGAWRDLATKATAVTIQRGGTRNTGANKIGVGTLDATLYGAVDLGTETALRPNAPIRVVQPGDRTVPLWESEPRSASTTVFTGVVPAALTGYATTGRAQTDAQNGVTTGTGPGLVLQANMPTITIPTGYTNRLAQRVLGPEVGMTPEKSYTLDVSMRDYQYSTAYPRVPLRLVAYAWDAAAGAIVGDALGTSLPRPFAQTMTPFPSLIVVAPTGGLSILLTVQVASATPVVNTTANTASAFILAFDPVKVGNYFPNTPRFTGTIADVAQAVNFDKATETKQVYTSLFAVDAVQSLANTQRYGAVSESGQGYQPWAERIQQLATSALVTVNTPPASERAIYTWPGDAVTPFYGNDFSVTAAPATAYSAATTLVTGTTPAIQYSVTKTNTGTAAFSFAPTISQGSGKVQTPGLYRVDFDLTTIALTGVTLGAYAIRFSKTTGKPITVPAAGATQHYSLEFLATGPDSGPNLVSTKPTGFTTGTGAREFTIQMSNYSIRAIGDPKGYQLADVVYESDLASHFDLACNSVGARWWVDRDGVVQFSRTLNALTTASSTPDQIAFSDNHDGSLEYVDIDLAFDTRNVVNALTLAQHGRVPDTAVENAGNADDYNVSFTSFTSINRWGSRAGTIDTCLYAGPGFESAPEVRAREVISDLGRPTYSATSVQWNAQQNPATVPLLDIYTPVSVTYESLRQVARVIGIKETITPTRWLIDLDLTDIKTGATFADLADAWDGLTFADVAARLGTKTFAQFDGDPLS